MWASGMWFLRLVPGPKIVGDWPLLVCFFLAEESLLQLSGQGGQQRGHGGPTVGGAKPQPLLWKVGPQASPSAWLAGSEAGRSLSMLHRQRPFFKHNWSA
jgi:hypothetical protein